MTPITSSADFQRVSKLGKRFSFSAFIMLGLRREPELPFRTGLTVSRKVGNAVTRNRVKRRLREIIRLSGMAEKCPGWDVVLIGRTAAASYDFARLQADFMAGLEKLGAGK